MWHSFFRICPCTRHINCWIIFNSYKDLSIKSFTNVIDNELESTLAFETEELQIICLTYLLMMCRLLSVPRTHHTCADSLQLLQQVVKQLPTGSFVELRIGGLQFAGNHMGPHGSLSKESSANSEAAASWGLLRVAASEMPVCLIVVIYLCISSSSPIQMHRAAN